MVLTPSLAKQVFAQRQSVLSTYNLFLRMQELVFGDKGLSAQVPELEEQYFHNLNVLMLNSAVMDASNRTASFVGKTIVSLISFAKDPADQMPWERVSDVRVLDERQAEGSLFTLVSRWAYCASMPAMFGQAFLDQCPMAMDDIFLFHAELPYLVTGLPAPNQKIFEAMQARDRCREAVRRWFHAHKAVKEGKYPGAGWGDMKDISEFAKLQHRLMDDGGAPEEVVCANLLGFLILQHTVISPFAWIGTMKMWLTFDRMPI